MVVLSRGSPEETPPCVKLAPYVHQVGGHVAVLALDSSTICKPHIDKEYQFYQDLPEGLHKFVPQFKGVADVVVQKARDGYLNLVACPYPGGRLQCPPQEGDGQVERDAESREHAQSHTAPSLRTKPVYRVRLSEGGSLSIDQDSDNDDLFEDLSTESGLRRFGCNPWSIHCHRQQITKMREEQGADQSHKFLMLENVTNRFHHPCILDLKIGLRSHSDDATEAKKQSHKAKVQSTTSAKLGVRVCGMQVYRPDKGRFLCWNKYYGRRLSEEGLRQLVAEFVFDGQGYRVDIISAIMEEITSLQEVLSGLHHYRFYGSSLLLIYEGSSGPDGSTGKENLYHIPPGPASDRDSSNRNRKDYNEPRREDEEVGLSGCLHQNQCRNREANGLSPTLARNSSHHRGKDLLRGAEEVGLNGRLSPNQSRNQSNDLNPGMTLARNSSNHRRKEALEALGDEDVGLNGYVAPNQCRNPEGNDLSRDLDSALTPAQNSSHHRRKDSLKALEGEEEVELDGCVSQIQCRNLGRNGLTHNANPAPILGRNSSHHRRKDSPKGQGGDVSQNRCRNLESDDSCDDMHPDLTLALDSAQHGKGVSCELLVNSEEIGIGSGGLWNQKRDKVEDKMCRFDVSPSSVQNCSRHRREELNDGSALAESMEGGGIDRGRSIDSDDCNMESEEVTSLHFQEAAMTSEFDSDSVARCGSELNQCRLDGSSTEQVPSTSSRGAPPPSAWSGEVKRPCDSLSQSNQRGRTQKQQRTTVISSSVKDIPIREDSDQNRRLPSLPGSSQQGRKVASCPPLVHIKMIDFAHSEFKDQNEVRTHRSEGYSGTDYGPDSEHARIYKGHGTAQTRAKSPEAGGYEGPDRDFLYGLRNLLEIFRALYSNNGYDSHGELCCGEMWCED